MAEFYKIYSKNVVQYARFFLALSLIITLLFTPFNDLFPAFHIEKMRSNMRELSVLNYYFWFENIKIPYYITLFILFFVISGFYPKYSAFFHWIATYSTFYTMFIIEGGDQISVIITLLLIPICISDNRKNAWKNEDTKKLHNKYFLYISYTTYIVVQIQIALLYLNAGTAKFSVAEWIDGTAVYYWFNNNIFGAPDIIKSSIGFLFTNKITLTFINWGSMMLEIMLFVAFFLQQRYKYILIFIAFLFHFSIFLIHGLGTFWVSMTGCLILYLFNPTISFKENLKEMFKVISTPFNYKFLTTSKA